MKRAAISTLLFLGTFTITFGQQSSYTENRAEQTLRATGRVNPATLGMEMQIPLGMYPGRGISLPIGLSYSSKVWRMKHVDRVETYGNPSTCHPLSTPIFAEYSASGWTSSMGVPYIEYTGKEYQFDDKGYPVDPSASGMCGGTIYAANDYVRRIQVHLANGESHELRADDTVIRYDPSNGSDTNNPNTQANWNTTYYATDGSNIKYVEDSTTSPATYRLLMPDGSSIDFASSTVTSPYGGSYGIRKAESTHDRNGNVVTYHDGYATDTLGRDIPIPVGLVAPSGPTPSSSPQPVELPGYNGGTPVTYKLHWKELQGATSAESGLTNYSDTLCYRAPGYPWPGTSFPQVPSGSCILFDSNGNGRVYEAIPAVFNPIVLTQIELPNGASYKFGYDIYARMNKITYPTGGTETFTYSAIDALNPPSNPSDDIDRQANFGVTQRDVKENSSSTAITWTYSVGSDPASPYGYQMTTVAPDGTKTERAMLRGNQDCTGCTVGTFGFDTPLAGMAYAERSYTSDSTPVLISKKLTTWTTTQLSITSVAGTISTAADWHPRVTKEESIIYDPVASTSLSASTVMEYDSDLSAISNPANINAVKQYGFTTSLGSLGTLLKTVETTYSSDSNYLALNLKSLPTAVQAKDGSGTVVSRNEIVYDESGSSPGYRGNPTTSKAWDSTKGVVTGSGNYISTHAKFDSYGNQYEATDALGNTTTTTFDSTYHTFPITVTSPVPDSTNTYGSNTAFVTSSTFDASTGLLLTTTNPNELTTAIEYDSTTLRPRYVRNYEGSTQIGGTAETIYHDETGNYWVKSKVQIDDTHYAESITYYDGLGRAYKTEKVDAGGNIFTEKEFDADGRVSRVCNPYRSGETKQWTTNVYDTASRVVEVDLPDSSTVLTAYGVSASGTLGITKTITDQAGKKRKGYSDAMGNMVRVVEDPASSALVTDYVFDTLGNLRKTTQGDQNRYFMHDSLGRLLYAKQVEQDTNSAFSATDPVTSNTAWSEKYEYNDNGNITKTTDAKNKYIEATYDHLNRITLRNYEVTDMPDVSFYYDGRGLASVPDYSKGKTTKITSSVSETKYMSFDIFGHLLTHRQTTDGNDYDTSYTYNLGGALIDETYPSGRVVKNTPDADGHLAQVQSKKNSSSGYWTYANSLTYDAAGAVTKMQLGNGRWETAEYNNRLQITKIGLGTTDSTKDFLELDYDYNTSGNHDNNGDMLKQTIKVPGVSPDFVQTYTYDALNRLSAAEEKQSTTTTWKQEFSYDRYGNRNFITGSGHTTTLGSCSTAVCNPTISTSNNRFSSGQGYSYDANGNVTQDASSQRFGYDQENHQTAFFGSSNSGSTPDATYSYDGDGKRVKKISSTETTVFVYDGGGQMIAEYSTALASTQQVSYLTQDHLGSQRIVTNENGTVTDRKDFASFGEEVTASRTSGNGYTSAQEPRQDYTGYEKDGESGLEYAQARFYNPTHGRFTSVDPLAASATIRNPQTFNRYSYVLNSPYKFSDPLGLRPQDWSSSGYCGAEFSSCDGGSSTAPGEAEYEERLQNTYDAIDANQALQRGDQATVEMICANNLSLTCSRDDEGSVSVSVTIEPDNNIPGDENVGIEVIIWDEAWTTHIGSSYGHVSYIIDGVSWSFDSDGFHDQKAADYTNDRRTISGGTGYVLDFGSAELNQRFKVAILKAYDQNSAYSISKNNCGSAFLRAINSIAGDLGIPLNDGTMKPKTHGAYIQNNLKKFTYAINTYPYKTGPTTTWK